MGHASLARPYRPELGIGTVEEESTNIDGPLPPHSALATVEFEPVEGKNGSKVLMVEWDATMATHEQNQHGGSPRPLGHQSHPTESAWKVSWEGMPVTLAVRDRDEGPQRRERQFFLLPPGSQFPTHVTITHSTGLAMSAKPLPATYPDGLGLDVGAGGILRKLTFCSAAFSRDPLREETGLPAQGKPQCCASLLSFALLTPELLDTLWAKNRIADLEDEIRKEMSINTESVGLEMVIQEKAWILEQFGIAPLPDTTAAFEKVPLIPPPKPRSTGRLPDQSRCLKLATSPEDLAAAALGSF